MGTKIAAYYSEADALGGLEAKIKLATLTRIPSNRAHTEADTPETLSLFETAMVDLRKLFARVAMPSRRTAPGMRLGRVLPGSEELLWGVLSSLQDAVFVLFNAEGRCAWAWASETLAESFGVDAAEDVGSLGDFIGAFVAEHCMNDIRHISTGGASAHRELALDFRGTPHWLSVGLSPVHDVAGRAGAVAAFVQDITDRKATEERLRASEERLRQHNQVFLELIADKAQFLGNRDRTLLRVTEAAARTLDVARSSVWFYDPERTKIVCADLYERDTERHSQGVELGALGFPAYFAALAQERTIAAHDAHTDPRTSAFSEPYLKPLGINSMLDVPIRVNGQMIGVLCNEHTGPVREWTADEENFAYLLASLFSLAQELGQ